MVATTAEPDVLSVQRPLDDGDASREPIHDQGVALVGPVWAASVCQRLAVRTPLTGVFHPVPFPRSRPPGLPPGCVVVSASATVLLRSTILLI
jgi:hypothetical protein